MIPLALPGRLMAALLPAFLLLASRAADPSLVESRSADVEWLRETAREVLGAARVPAGAAIPHGPTNTTPYALRVPGGTQNYYPAFWIRDAAMMLGGDFIPSDEIAGWIRVIAATQPGPDGLHFGKLTIPAFSIPDHITLDGRACWFPGAYTEQGRGAFGFLPPADDAFFFIQMVFAHWHQTQSLDLFNSTVQTGWGTRRLSEVCDRAFASVAVDPATGLVQCDAEEGRTRVDWGFCDSIRKSGLCLMPSLLRWEAAIELAQLFEKDGNSAAAARYRHVAERIQTTLGPTFARELPPVGGVNCSLLCSATGLGRKDDVWASAYAVWLRVLPHDLESAVAHHLLDLYRKGGTVKDGQVRHLPPNGDWGGYWEEAESERGKYQNGGYWATPTGWLIVALRRVDSAAADQLLAEYAAYLRRFRKAGAPWEWIQPELRLQVNALYGSSAGAVSIALENAPPKP